MKKVNYFFALSAVLFLLCTVSCSQNDLSEFEIIDSTVQYTIPPETDGDFPTFEISFQKTKFPMEFFGKEIRNLKQDIIDDYQNHSMFSSRSPGYLMFNFDSYKEAQEFIGLEYFNEPTFDFKQEFCHVSVVGKENGDIREITVNTFFKENDINLSVYAYIFTEKDNVDIYGTLHRFSEGENSIEYKTTENGIEYLYSEFHNENDRYSGSANFIFNGIHYMISTNSNYSQKQEALDILHKALNQFKK